MSYERDLYGFGDMPSEQEITREEACAQEQDTRLRQAVEEDTPLANITAIISSVMLREEALAKEINPNNLYHRGYADALFNVLKLLETVNKI